MRVFHLNSNTSRLFCTFLCLVMLTGCAVPHNDFRYDEPDYKYLLVEKKTIKEIVGYNVAWTLFSDSDLDTYYVESKPTSAEQVSVNLKYISSTVREDSELPYESWYIVQQTGSMHIHRDDLIHLEFYAAFENITFVEDTHADNIVTYYWLTSNPVHKDTCVVRLQSRSYFHPDSVQVFVGTLNQGHVDKYLYSTKPTDCQINYNLGYKSTQYPLSLVLLGGKHYIMSGALVERKDYAKKVAYRNISVIPIDGTYSEFQKAAEGHLHVAYGNTFVMSNRKRCYEYKSSMRLLPALKISFSVSSDAYEYEEPAPFVMKVVLRSKSKPLDELLNHDYIPAVYTLKDDYKNSIPIMIDSKIPSLSYL